ncbi:hypothetical protein ACHAXN_011532 [Cyclotella atomus]
MPPRRSMYIYRRVVLSLWLLITTLLVHSPTTVNGTQVNWSGNQNVDPKHKSAHDAPRSQKYWDEHGIERPDYAKTDAEISAERRQRGGESSSGWQTWMGTLMIIFYVTFGVAAVSSIGYGTYTGDWSVILNNPVTEFIDRSINRTLEAGGMKGHKLGSISDASQSTQNSASEEEKRRLARLARFENAGKDLLDSMKED